MPVEPELERVVSHTHLTYKVIEASRLGICSRLVVTQ